MKSIDKSRNWTRINAEFFAQFATRRDGPTSGMTQARSSANIDVVLWLFILASVPAMMVSAWSAGHQLLTLDAAGDWSQTLAAFGFSMAAGDWQSSFVLGLLYIGPKLLIVGAVSLFWALLFARIRGQTLDPGWLMTTWLFVLLIPPDLPLLLASLGISFAAVMGLHIFGGTGRYIVSPAALGALFVQFSYPNAGIVSNGVSWSGVIKGIGNGQDAAMPDVAVIALEAGAVPTLVACIAGAVLLSRAGVVSWRILAGGSVGVLLAGTLVTTFSELPVASINWQWHLSLGFLPLCLVFILTDPTTSALTRQGRWIQGLMFAFFVVAIRVLDPTHPDGSLFAVLLATLSVPLIDYIVIRRNVARAHGRLEVRT